MLISTSIIEISHIYFTTHYTDYTNDTYNM